MKKITAILLIVVSFISYLNAESPIQSGVSIVSTEELGKVTDSLESIPNLKFSTHLLVYLWLDKSTEEDLIAEIKKGFFPSSADPIIDSHHTQEPQNQQMVVGYSGPTYVSFSKAEEYTQVVIIWGEPFLPIQN